MKVAKKKKDQWYYDFTYNNKRYRLIAGITKGETEEAMHVREAIEAQKARPGKFGPSKAGFI